MRRTLVLGAVLLGTATRMAHASPEVMQLVYAGAPGCPDVHAFEAEVRTRLPEAQFSEAPSDVQIFVELRATPTPYGQLRLTRRGDVEQPRTVRGHTCEEVVRGLALIAALVIDGRVAPNAAAVPPAEPVDEAEDEEADNDQMAVARSPATTTRAQPPLASRAERSRPNEVAWPWWGGAMATISAGTTFDPGPLWLMGGGVEVGYLPGRWGGLARVMGSVGWMPEVVFEEARARFSRWMIGAEVCPALRVFGEHLSIRACARLDLGQLHAAGAAGSRIVRDRSETTTIIQVRESLWARYRIGAAYLELGAGLVQTPTYPEWYFDNIPTAIGPQRVKLAGDRPLGAELILGAGVRFF